MAQENNIAQQLNDLLVTRDFHPELRNAAGSDKNVEPKDAKVFRFGYVSGTGKNYGTMVIILDSGNDLKAMFGDNLGHSMEDADKQEWYDFQQQLSQFANSHRWTYTGADISKLKYTMQGLAAIKEGLFEGYYGTRRISYAGEPTQARLMIRHNRNLGENDARFRYVESIFVETADGERHRLPFTNLAGGRAMLEHVRQGGKPYDVRGNHICEMITELKVLARFNRASQGRVVEGVKQSVVQGAQTYYKSLRESIKRLSSPRGYTAYFESWHPADITEQDQLVEDIKTLFVEQTIDDRIEQALPLLAKIQQGREMKEAEIFENWVNNVTEGTWSLPETPEQMTKLKELMSGELIVGPDGTNATEQLYDLIGDDEMFDRIDALAAQDPRANLWDDTEIQARMQELGIQMPDRAAPDMDAQPQQAMAEGSVTPNITVNKVHDDGHEKEWHIYRGKEMIGYVIKNQPDTAEGLYIAYGHGPGRAFVEDFAGLKPAVNYIASLKEGVAEGNMPQSVIKSKQKYSGMSDQEFHAAHKDKSEDELRAMAWRHGYGKGSNQYVNKHKKGQQGVAEGSKESNKDFKARQERLAAAAAQTAKDPKRLERLSKIPGYTAAMDLAKKTTKKEVQGMTEADNISAFESLQRMRHLSGMKLEEARIEESSEYTYEKIGQKLAQQQPHLDANSDQFRHAVYNEMIEMGMTPKSANFKLNYDEDFLSDVASAFYHYVRHQSDGQTVGQVMSQVGTRGLSGRPAPLAETQCNSTMEGHFCPEHGLSECWSQGMYEDILSTGIQLAEDDDTKARAKAALDDLDKPDTELKTSSDDAMRARLRLAAQQGKGTKLKDMNPLDRDQWQKEVDQFQKQKSTNEGLRDAVAKRVMSKMDNLRTVSKYPDAGVQQAGTMTPSLAGKVVSDYKQPLFKSRGPSTPYTPDEQQTMQGVKKQMQSQADRQSSLDYDGPRGSSAAPSPQATRAARSQSAAFDAQNNMRSNQDLFNRAYGIKDAYGIDEASMMNPEIPSDFGSDQHLRDLMKLAGAYRAGDRSSLQKSTNDLLARMTGQDKSSASAVAPSFGTPGAAHDGQGGYDYSDEAPDQTDAETARLARSGTADMPNDRRMNDADYINSLNLDMPKGQAHDGQGGSDYSNDPDQSDAETSRLNRDGNSVDLGLPPGQLDKNAWDDMMKTVPALDKDAWDDLVRGKVSEADRADGFADPSFNSDRWNSIPAGKSGPRPRPAKTPSFDVTKDPLFRAAMNRIDADNRAKSQMGSTVPTVPLSDLESIEPPRLSMVPTVDVTSTFESREGDALLARIKSLALIK